VVNEDQDFIKHDMGSNYNKMVDIWFYDDTAYTSMEAVGIVNDAVTTCLLGVRGTTSTTKYVYRIGSTWYATNINRVTGWHKLTWDYTSGTDVKMYIDDTLVHTSTALPYFNTISLGDTWANVTNTTYFDDVVVR
jgi:hypothetical protein